MMKKGLTDKEYEIMKVLWNSDKPMQTSEIYAKTETIAENSMHPIIKKLINRGYIRVVGTIRIVKVPCRLYVPGITLNEYIASQAREIFKYNNKELDMKGLLCCLVKKDKNKSSEYINAIEEFLREYKTEQ